MDYLHFIFIDYGALNIVIKPLKHYKIKNLGFTLFISDTLILISFHKKMFTSEPSR